MLSKTAKQNSLHFVYEDSPDPIGTNLRGKYLTFPLQNVALGEYKCRGTDRKSNTGDSLRWYRDLSAVSRRAATNPHTTRARITVLLISSLPYVAHRPSRNIWQSVPPRLTSAKPPAISICCSNQSKRRMKRRRKNRKTRRNSSSRACGPGTRYATSWRKRWRKCAYCRTY